MLDLDIEPGTYIVAVSGGVDSIVLLNLLSTRSDIKVIVAHVDHGIRDDSYQDAALVKRLAQQMGMPYEHTAFDLGLRASEQVARSARHAWLESIRQKHSASAILTAHHRDDVVETIIINLIRGTGWRGLSSLRNTDRYRRPLIRFSKTEIVAYAIDHDMQWREDSTNDDVRYLRNYIRHGVIPKLTVQQIQDLYVLYENQCKIGEMITAASKQLLHLASTGEGTLSRYWLIMIPDDVARELLRQKYGAMTSPQVSKLLTFARTARHGAKLELSKQHSFTVTSRRLIVGTS